MNTQNQKILLVDDDAATSEVLSKALKDEGYDVLTAPDGTQGLQLALKEHPGLILVDLLLPKLSGMSMIRELRQDTWGRDAEIFVLTNVGGDVGKFESARHYGVFRYLVKGDMSLENVVSTVKLHLEKIRSSPGAV